MTNPDDMPIDLDDMIAWIVEYKERHGLSWEALGKASGIPGGTLGPVCNGNYGGDHAEQARRIFRFKQQVESQEARQLAALERPRHIDTPTARRIQFLLEIAQMGRITVGALGPGTGKTITAETYTHSMSNNVWLVTMRQSTRTVSAMIGQVLTAMNMAKSGWATQRSTQVIEHVRGRQGLIIVDEANHLEWAAFEELRGWHDETGVGICLLGNEELILRIRGGANRHAYARLNSRIANYHVQDLPIEGDVTAYLDAMDIIEPDLRRPLIEKGLSPGHGGLREVQQILESAKMLSIADGTHLTTEHVRDAMSSRATTILRRQS